MKSAIYLLGAFFMTTVGFGAERRYAESVAMTGHAEDAATTFDVRIARFPEQNRGTLWFYAYVNGRQYSLVDEHVQLLTEATTPVAQADVTFSLTGSSSASLAGRDRYSANMTGHLQARGMLHPQAHPEPGQGEIPVEIEASFTAGHTPINVRAGRIEVMGRVRGTVRIDGQQVHIDLPGKWHEQTGERPSFAPAFTYLFLQGEERGLMATRHARGAWGYVFQDGVITDITALEIAPYGQPKREFTATLFDGSMIDGTATIVREVSVPIEGKRRPGATVVVDSDIGHLMGVLNDWRP